MKFIGLKTLHYPSLAIDRNKELMYIINMILQNRQNFWSFFSKPARARWHQPLS